MKATRQQFNAKRYEVITRGKPIGILPATGEHYYAYGGEVWLITLNGIVNCGPEAGIQDRVRISPRV